MGVRGLPVTVAEVGPADGKPVLLLHGHLDVVPGRQEQFIPRIEGDRLYGRGAYDMKGALACLLLALADLRSQDQVRVRLGIVPDEESEEETDRGGDRLVEAGFVGDFAITGEPTDLNVGVAAKGVLAMRLLVSGRAAHGATPWLGENAILRAYEVFREVESLPFAGQSSELFDRPSINLGRILGGDALNKVPDSCVIDVDVRYLPEQDPGEILAQVRGLEGARVISTFSRPPAEVDPELPLRPRACGMPPAPRATGLATASSAATAPRTRSRSCAPASRPWSSGRSAAATTAPRSGSRCPRWRGTAARSSNSSTALRGSPNDRSRRREDPGSARRGGGQPRVGGCPTPATWAGRRRSSSEDAGEHPQLPEDEPAEDEGEAEESPDGGEQPQEDAPQAEEAADDEPQAEEPRGRRARADEPAEADEEERQPRRPRSGSPRTRSRPTRFRSVIERPPGRRPSPGYGPGRPRTRPSTEPARSRRRPRRRPPRSRRRRDGRRRAAGGAGARGGRRRRRGRGAAAAPRNLAAVRRRVAADHRLDGHRDRAQPALLPQRRPARVPWACAGVQNELAVANPGEPADDPHPGVGQAARRARRSARGRTRRSCSGSPPTRSRCCRSRAT